MATLIDSSFFVGEINIPNTSKPEVSESLNLFIVKYEKELLRKMFGWELWKSYDTDATTERFLDIINGKDEWRGLVYDTNHSLIANYIYCWWIRDKQIWNSGIGTVRSKGDKSDIMPIYMKYIQAWNSMSNQIEEFSKYMSDNGEVYPEWKPIDLWTLGYVTDFDL